MIDPTWTPASILHGNTYEIFRVIYSTDVFSVDVGLIMNIASKITTGLCISISIGWLLPAAQSTFAQSQPEPRQIYEWIKQLEGEWTLSSVDRQEGGTKTHPSVVSLFGTEQVAMNFKLVGRESTVQEDLLPGTERQMVTMYHCQDSACSNVKATHYCAKKNQPEFLASRKSSSRELAFECDMSTELCQSWDGHIHRITHQLSDDGMHLRSAYANYLNGEHINDTIFHFDRKQ